MVYKRLKSCNIPRLRYTHLQQALEKKVKELIKNPNVKGIIIFGSIARGDYDANSDIELKVIDKGIKDHKVLLSREGEVDFNIHFNHSLNLKKRKQVKWRIEPPFAKSWIVIDKTGELRKLQQFDQKMSKKGREPLEKEEKLSFSHRLAELVRECKRFHNNPATLFLLLSEFIRSSLQFYYALNRIWWPGFKKVMDDIENRNSDIAKLIKEVISQGDPDYRIRLAEEILKELKS
ncbi:MAG: nucleotidyltransferase domain-containing protein [Candidatus Nealsonbacteria bacterium]|nr:MAG: nucleotidyltransferase domain-containing protein [Candidatus Nealsonbacteria bacterium]